MKALSIRQPWATLIVRGFKPVENRPRPWRYRGPLLIHAAKTFDLAGFEWIKAHRDALGLPADWIDLPAMQGGIIGQAELYDVTDLEQNDRMPLEAWTDRYGTMRNPERWYAGRYGLWLRQPTLLPFVPLRGQLGLFNVDEALLCP